MPTLKQSRARRLLVTSALILLPLMASYGQDVNQASGANTQEIVASAGSYKLQWRRHYGRQTGLLSTGAASDNGVLWLITHTGLGGPERHLTKISPDGELIANYKPVVPLNPFQWVTWLTPAASGERVGLLASVASGGKDQIFEGAFFLPVLSNGFGAPVRISGRGPQFPVMIGVGAGAFIAAGDQEPLTLIKLASDGKTIWRRAFSPKLVLPTVSAGNRGSVFVLSQAGAYVLLQMLDSSGRILSSRHIPGRQGAVVADRGGGCSVLYSIGFGGSNANKVYLITLDGGPREINQVETPLVGWEGRTYQLIASPRGHLIIGEAPEAHPEKEVPGKILAELDKSGTLLWQQAASSLETPLLAPFSSGFYLIRERSEGKGMDIEKYLY